MKQLNMKSVSLLSIFCFSLFSLGFTQPIGAQDKSGEIKELLEKRDRQIKTLLGPKGTEYTDGQREQLKDIINGIIDFRAMARYALQETYDTLAPAQREEFVDLFSTIIRDHSLNRLDIYRAEVIYNKIDVWDNRATVNTTAILDNVRTPVIYDMELRSTQREWVITDMKIDDVSTADSYRRQFQNIIRKRGFDYLMETLRKRAGKA